MIPRGSAKMIRHLLGGAISAAFIVIFIALSPAARAAQPLVDAAWAKANAGKAGVVFIDVRAKSDYLRGHIPGAVNTNYAKDGWRVSENGVPGMFPKDTAPLAKLIGGLGIGPDTHVVLVAPGNSASDMGTATRLYWTFKVLGHDNVSVLNGGMKAYLANVDKSGKPLNPLARGMAKVTAQNFPVHLQTAMLITTQDVKKAEDSGVTLIDNRTADQYMGVNRHPKSKASGTIPGARNLPESWLTENNGGMFRSAKELKELYAAAGIPDSGKQITFCNTGHWASLGWFASSEILGDKQAKMYDGSMTQWTSEHMPVEQKVKLQ